MPEDSFPKKEEEIVNFWEKSKIFQKTLEKPSSRGDFVFYDGPPFATGLPHYGHLIAGTIKDVIPRYKTMHGFRVPRRWGWDCHGLPIENLIEKEKGFASKKDIEKDIAGFNDACHKSVLKYRDDWKNIIERTARWVDMENDYQTMDSRYTEVIWWIFKELYNDKLIYEGYKSMHLCPRCETTLSNFEVTLGYQEVKDIGITAAFKLESGQKIGGKVIPENTAILAWTTTGWTLPGNTALAVGEDIVYVMVEHDANSSESFSRFIVAKERMGEVFKKEEAEELPAIVQEFKGKDLVGLKYEPLFSDSVEQLKEHEYFNNAFKVYGAEFVNTDEGTGIAHEAPAFGADDYELSKKHNIPFLQHVNTDGTFKEYVTFAPGLAIKTKDDRSAGDVAVIKYLAKHGGLFKKEKYLHSYPHCWRCDTPLLNYATSSWFVKVTALKERLLKVNKKVKWVPGHLRDGRFGKWLEGARDWAISRSRFWGAPIPVWRCEQEGCQETVVVGSVEELLGYDKNRDENNKTSETEVLFGSEGSMSSGARPDCHRFNSIHDSKNAVKQDKNQPAEGLEPSTNPVTTRMSHRAASRGELYHSNKSRQIDGDGASLNLHRPYIDEVTFACTKCKGTMKRIKEVFDCWFESGSMPYASEIIFSDYSITPDTTKEDMRAHINFPADFIAEGVDQTRGWFYTLMVLGVALYNESPFKSVVVNGIILAENGQKMSKRLKNYPDPLEIVEKYGADALRFYLMSSPAVRAESFNFSEKGVDEVYKKVILLALNVTRFFETYAPESKEGRHGKEGESAIQTKHSPHVLDKWITARLNELIKEATAALDAYKIDKACRPITEFINDLSTWYLRRSRDRFKEDGADKQNALETLRSVLNDLSKVMAPITPFLAEHIYQETGGKRESVHLEEWPKSVPQGKEHGEVLVGMENVRTISEIGHSLRDEASIKVRQVLRAVEIKKDKGDLKEDFRAFILDELNVKEVALVETLQTSEGWVGKDGIALNTKIDDELKEEGLVRELTRHINSLRKKQGLTIHDTVVLEYTTDSEELKTIIEKHKGELQKAVLAKDIVINEKAKGEEITVEGTPIELKLEKI